MENRGSTRFNGRIRRPLSDLSSQMNNRQGQNNDHFPIKQSFTIYRDEPSNSTTSHNRPCSSKFNDENKPPLGLQIQQPPQQKSAFPPPPPLPIATSSPASLVIRHEPLRQKFPSHSSASEDEAMTSEAVNIDPYALISKSSASDFRRNNDSISSTTTDEDDLEVEDVLDCDEDVINVENVDLEGRLVETLNEEYALDILKGMMEREVNFLPKWNYMTKQPDITFTMRSILIDWLVEVGEEYKLSTETLFLAVNYIDRFLSFMSVQRAKLQLVGTACMFIAAKYEEIYPPDVTEFCYITDDTYTKRQVLRMEQLVLGVLNFECAPPTAHFFVNHLAGLAGCGPKATALAQYLTELTMIDGEAFLPFSPSVIGAAAVALSRHTLGLAAWEDSMVAKTGYNVEDFKECLIRLHETFERAPEMAQQAVREKYKNASYHSVSEVKPTPIF